MNKSERITAHFMDFGPDYMPNPHGHLNNQRDLFHYEKALEFAERSAAKKILDVGCFDGWLDLLLIEKGYDLTGVELIPTLVSAGLLYALKHHIDYMIYLGFFEDIIFTDWEKFDMVMCLETLEHVDLEETVPIYIEKMEALSLRGIFISLPDQDHGDNKQHLWTPTEKVLRDLWGKKRNLFVEYHQYDDPNIPPNWLIYYEV
jgi:2-polyprenyl-3-methyl-5-hydroxy-6-metoxy-1,4-benzoquinol methylase